MALDEWNFRENGSLYIFFCPPPFWFFVFFIDFLLFPPVISFPSLSSVFRQSKYTKISAERNRHSSWFWSEPSERGVDFNIDVHTRGHPITMWLRWSTDFSSLTKITHLFKKNAQSHNSDFKLIFVRKGHACSMCVCVCGVYGKVGIRCLSLNLDL